MIIYSFTLDICNDCSKYLGNTLNNQNRISEASQERIQQGNHPYFANIRIFRNKLFKRQGKMKIYMSMVNPVVTCGWRTHVVRKWWEPIKKVWKKNLYITQDLAMMGIRARKDWQMTEDSGVGLLQRPRPTKRWRASERK